MSDSSAATYETATSIQIGEAGPAAWVERTAIMPEAPDPLVFGVRPAIAPHYGVQPDQFSPRSTTTDIMSAAIGACMAGTFLSFLEARSIALTRDDIKIEMISRVGPDPNDNLKTPIIQAVHLDYVIAAAIELRAKIERVHQVYHRSCWLSETLRGSRCHVTSALSFSLPPGDA